MDDSRPQLLRMSHTDEMMLIFRKAVHEAQEDSRRMGVPNVYSLNGRRFFELPNGEITSQVPIGWYAVPQPTPKASYE